MRFCPSRPSWRSKHVWLRERVPLTVTWMVPRVPRLFRMRFDQRMLLSRTPSGWAPKKSSSHQSSLDCVSHSRLLCLRSSCKEQTAETMINVDHTLQSVQMQINEGCAICVLALRRICKNPRKAAQAGSVAVNSRCPSSAPCKQLNRGL